MRTGITAAALFVAAFAAPAATANFAAAAEPDAQVVAPFPTPTATCRGEAPHATCSASAGGDGAVHLRADVPHSAGPTTSAGARVTYSFTFVLDQPATELRAVLDRVLTTTSTSASGASASTNELLSVWDCSCSGADSSTSGNTVSARIVPVGTAVIPPGPVTLRWDVRASAHRHPLCSPLSPCRYPLAPAPANTGSAAVELHATLSSVSLFVTPA